MHHGAHNRTPWDPNGPPTKKRNIDWSQWTIPCIDAPMELQESCNEWMHTHNKQHPKQPDVGGIQPADPKDAHAADGLVKPTKAQPQPLQPELGYDWSNWKGPCPLSPEKTKQSCEDWMRTHNKQKPPSLINSPVDEQKQQQQRQKPSPLTVATANVVSGYWNKDVIKHLLRDNSVSQHQPDFIFLQESVENPVFRTEPCLIKAHSSPPPPPPIRDALIPNQRIQEELIV